MAEDTGILLESGTNELELLEFVVGSQHYGINVAKISELCPYQPPTMVPNAHEYIEGIFMPRERIITVINLAKALGIAVNQNTAGDILSRILTVFTLPFMCRRYWGSTGCHGETLLNRTVPSAMAVRELPQGLPRLTARL